MKFLISLALVFLLLSCATSKEIYTPEGDKGHVIDCSGTAMTWGNCYEKAGKICGENGYVILEKSSEGAATMGGGSYSFFGGAYSQRTLVIKCKKCDN